MYRPLSLMSAFRVSPVSTKLLNPQQEEHHCLFNFWIVLKNNIRQVLQALLRTLSREQSHNIGLLICSKDVNCDVTREHKMGVSVLQTIT